MIKQRFNILDICLLFLFALAILLHYLTPYPLYLLAIPALVFQFIKMLVQYKMLNLRNQNNSIQLYGTKSYKNTSNLALLILFIIILVLQLSDLSDTRGWFWILLIASFLVKDLAPLLNWYIMIDNHHLHFNSLWKKSVLISEITDIQLIKENKIEIRLGKKEIDFEVDPSKVSTFIHEINKIRSSLS